MTGSADNMKGNKLPVMIGFVLLVAAALGSAGYYWHSKGTHYPMGFKHLGKNGDSAICGNVKYPKISRMQSGTASIFLVKAAIACGLEIRKPSHYVVGDTIHLSYEAYSTGSYAMCDCEYRSVYSFIGLPSSVTKVTFKVSYADSSGGP